MRVEWSHEVLVQLLSILVNLYKTKDRALDVADQIGLPLDNLRQSDVLRTLWWSIITETDNQRLLPELVAYALRDYPRHEGLRAIAAGRLNDVPGPDIEKEVDWKANFEVVIDDADFFPYTFLAAGTIAGAAVVRIDLGERRYGSGFLIAKDLVLTNHHVLPNIDVARTAVIEVGCEETLEGVAIVGVRHASRADECYESDNTDDWAVVKIDPVEGCTPIALAPVEPPKRGERVFIIQHPGGEAKQIALGANTVTYCDERRLQYLTDTRPGSSGSPIFDRKWRLVGIHHSGGWMTEPNSKREQFRNEGIAIGCVRDALVKAGILP